MFCKTFSKKSTRGRLAERNRVSLLFRRAVRATASLVLSAAALCGASARGDDDPTMFPFVVEQGAHDNITDVRTWDGGAVAPAGSDGFVRVDGDSLATDSGKIRFLGTGFCFSASFCSHEKADRVADSLARFGIRCLRLHHMDRRDIWGENLEKGTTEIDPKQLDKLDYLVSRLEAKGIYVNLNLHVSRRFREIDGFPNADALPFCDKGVDNFDRKMIELQKKYAKDLLTHVNPYTGKAYVDDPGVAVVEINNENSIVASWSGAWGTIDALPEPYAGEFKALWNEWLRKKYGSSDALRAAWNSKEYPLGDNILKNADFPENFAFNAADGWKLEADAHTGYSCRVLPPNESGLESNALEFKVGKIGSTYWNPQFWLQGIKLEPGKPYKLSFKIRSTAKRPCRVYVGEQGAPSVKLGLNDWFDAAPEWKTLEFSFACPATSDLARIVFTEFQEGAEIALADVELREGGRVGLDPSVSLEDGEVPALKRNGGSNFATPEALADFNEFLRDLEADYWNEMRDYVKSLGTKSPVVGTQLQYGHSYAQARFDFCDVHAYWNHPGWPKGEWNPDSWFVGNSCMANSPTGGTLPGIGAIRVLGKPYSCSEYDHPFPNQYCAEGNLMLAAFAAFQDWSIISQHAWLRSDYFDPDPDFELQYAKPFFDMSAQPVKLAHLPACYALFARGDVQTGPGEFYYAPEISERAETDAMKNLLSGYHRALVAGYRLDPSLTLAVYSGVELNDLGLPKSPRVANAKRVASWNELPEKFGGADKKEYVNEFGEIRWNVRTPGKGYFVVDAARSKVFSGFVGAPILFDGVKLEIGTTRLGWATVSLAKAKGLEKDDVKNGTLSKGSWLLTLTGDMRNTGEKLAKTDNGGVTTAKEQGGAVGEAPVLLEGIPATLTLANLKASDVEVYALDAAGDRKEKIEVVDSADGAKVVVGSEYRTIWYEAIVK